MQSNKGSVISVVFMAVLVILNLGLMGVIWYDRLTDHRPPRPATAPDPSRLMIDELGLKGEQLRAYEKSRDEQWKTGDSIRNETYRLEVELTEELFKVSPDSLRLQQLVEAIGRKQAEFDLVLLRHFRHVKLTCTPEQQDRLKRLALDFLLKSRRPQAPSPQGPGASPYRSPDDQYRGPQPGGNPGPPPQGEPQDQQNPPPPR